MPLFSQISTCTCCIHSRCGVSPRAAPTGSHSISRVRCACRVATRTHSRAVLRTHARRVLVCVVWRPASRVVDGVVAPEPGRVVEGGVCGVGVAPQAGCRRREDGREGPVGVDARAGLSRLERGCRRGERGCHAAARWSDRNVAETSGPFQRRDVRRVRKMSLMRRGTGLPTEAAQTHLSHP